MKLLMLASSAEMAQGGLSALIRRYGANNAPEDSDVIVALGGDGFMLDCLHAYQSLGVPIYGMNCGTVGFLMNAYDEEDLIARIDRAELATLNPLQMRAELSDGAVHSDLAINEVSLLRGGPQAAKLAISIDGQMRLECLVCDGAMVATPAGSTAYNYSAHGPILPIGAGVLALTPLAAVLPRRWRGAVLPLAAQVRIDVLDADKRPVNASADGKEVSRVRWVEILIAPQIEHRILFNPGHGLEERLLRQQFV